jgi:hypothetical protein
MRTYTFAIASLLIVPSGTVAIDIYVDNLLGDDRRAGTSTIVSGDGGGPCRTISRALRAATPGDRIVVANTGQPYRESLTLQGPRLSGSDRYPTTIVGNGATLDGTTLLAGANWEFVGSNTFRTRPIHKSYQQMFLDDQPLPRHQPAPGQPPSLQPREWCLHQGWLYFRVDGGRLPEDYNVSCCGEQVGITLYNVHDVVIQDLIVRGFWLDGVNCHDNVRSVELINVGAGENGRSGFSAGGTSRVRLQKCAAAANGAAQLRVEGLATVEMESASLDATTAPAIVREGGRIIERTGR